MKKAFASLFVINGILNLIFGTLRFFKEESNVLLLVLFGVLSLVLGVFLLRSEKAKGQ